MTLDCRDWLPDGAFDHPSLVQTLEESVRSWASRWYGERDVLGSASLQTQAMPPPDRGEGTTRKLGCGAWIDWPEETQLALACLALNYQGRGNAHSRDDRSLLCMVANRMLAELGRDIERALGSPSMPDSEDVPIGNGIALHWKIAGVKRELALHVEHWALVGMRKRICGTAMRRSTVKAPLLDVVGSQPVAVEVVLGAARVSALELRDLVPGDVVMVDARRDSALDLRRTGTAGALARVVLERSDNALVLKAKRG